MKDQFASEPFEIETPEAAKDFVMSLPLQPWPKIPRAYAVTRYDSLAECLVQGRTVARVRDIDCRVLEGVFGLALQYESETAQWLGKRVPLLENSRRTALIRLLGKLWRTHGLLRIAPESTAYRDELAVAVQDLEEAFIDTPTRREQTVAEAEDLLERCPTLPTRPHRMPVPRMDKFLPPVTLKGLTALQRPPRWPKGF